MKGLKMAGKGLFHYTTFDALEGILSNKEIWLGNLKYMNDRLEMEIFQIFRRSISKDPFEVY